MDFSVEEKERYSRHIILQEFGEEAQQKLKAASILLIGAGGLGCPALLYLAAAGVGCIGIADDDKVALSNLQRQVLYTTEDIGNYKAVAAQKRLSLLNPNIKYKPIIERINAENILPTLNDYDLVIDGTDNFATRYLINDACVLQQKPFVYGAIFKFEGQVSVFNLDDGPTYRCLFPEPPLESEILSCNNAGVLGVLPGIVGTWQATEAIKIITGVGQPLKGRLLSFDLIQNKVSSFDFPMVPSNKHLEMLMPHETACNREMQKIDKKTFEQWLHSEDIQVIDVREEAEHRDLNMGGKNIPFTLLDARFNEIDATKKTVVFCQSGVRSAKAARLIKNYFPEIEIYDLENGLAKF